MSWNQIRPTVVSWWRERLAELLMISLYRSGRQGDALREYHVVRRRLVDEFGMEPSTTLRDRRQAIHNHDPRSSSHRKSAVRGSPDNWRPLPAGESPSVAIVPTTSAHRDFPERWGGADDK